MKILRYLNYMIIILCFLAFLMLDLVMDNDRLIEIITKG